MNIIYGQQSLMPNFKSPATSWAAGDSCFYDCSMSLLARQADDFRRTEFLFLNDFYPLLHRQLEQE